MAHDKQNEAAMKKKVDLVEVLDSKLQSMNFGTNSLKAEVDLIKRQFSV